MDYNISYEKKEYHFIEWGYGLLRIEYSKKAVKYINTLDRPTKQRIKKAIEGLTETPPKGDIKTLQGFFQIIESD